MDGIADKEYLVRLKQIHAFNNDPRMNEVRQFYNTPSLWQIMNIARRETSHSAFIAYYLNAGNHHSLGDSFLRLFLQQVIIKAIEQKKNIDANFSHRIMLASNILATYIKPEEFMQVDDEKGRFDIFMRCFIPDSVLSDSDSVSKHQDEEFIVVIENKVIAKETKTRGKGQTEKYKRYIDEKFPGQNKLFVLLSPDNRESIASGKGLKVECEDFIRLSYQDLLTGVIEPILGNGILNQEDETRLKDYVKCLSIPALEEGTNKERSKSIIMAMSSKETKLLMDFWNNNEDLIKACLSAIASNEEFSEEAREIASKASATNFHRDSTKYSLGCQPDSKESRSSLVPVFITKWAEKNHIGDNYSFDKAFIKLNEAFPETLRGGKNSREGIIYKTQPASDYKDRNFPSITVGNFTFYVAANIWTKERFAHFLERAKVLANGDTDLEIKVL